MRYIYGFNTIKLEKIREYGELVKKVFLKYYLLIAGFSMLCIYVLQCIAYPESINENEVVAWSMDETGHFIAVIILICIYCYILSLFDKYIISMLPFREYLLLAFILLVHGINPQMLIWFLTVMIIGMIFSLLIISKHCYLLIIPFSLLITYYLEWSVFIILSLCLFMYYSIGKQKRSVFLAMGVSFFLSLIELILIRASFWNNVTTGITIAILFSAFMASFYFEKIHKEKSAVSLEFLMVIDITFFSFFQNDLVSYEFCVFLFLVFIVSQIKRNNITITEFSGILYGTRFNTYLITYAVFCMAAYLCQVFINRDIRIDYFCITHYYMNYIDYGFVQRGFIGTFIRLIGGYKIPLDSMIIIVFVIYNLSLIFVLLMFHSFKNLSVNQVRMYIPCLILFVVKIFPSMFAKLQGRFDVYLILLEFIIIYIVSKKRKLLFLIPVLCAIGMMIHPAYAFIAYPTVFMALCTGFLSADDNRFAKKRALLLIETIIITLSFLIYCSFIAYNVLPMDFDEAKSIFIERSGNGVVDVSFWDKMNLFFRTNDNITLRKHAHYYSNKISYIQVMNAVRKLFWFTPLFAFFFYIYFRWAKQFDVKYKRIICKLLPFSILMFLPPYLVEVDYGRWSVAMLTMVLCGLLIPDMMVLTDKSSPYYDIPEKTYGIMIVFVIVGCLATDLFGVFI